MSVWTDAVAALSPYLWWKLDETSGTTAADSSGNSHPGTYSNTGSITYHVTGLIPGDPGGFAAGLLGTSFVRSTALTFERINITAVGTFTYSSDSTGDIFYMGANNALVIGASTTNAKINATSFSLGYDPTPLRDGNPHFLVYKISATAAELWVDGTMVGSASHSVVAGADLTTFGNANSAFLGTWDDLLLFTTALSSAQIGNLWSAWQGIVAGSVSAIGSASTDAVAVGAATVHGVLLGNTTSSATVAGSSAVSGTVAAEGVSNATAAGTTANIVTGVAIGAASTDATADGARIITGSILGNATSNALANGLASIGTDTTNRVGGRQRSGRGVGEWEPPVLDPATAFVGPVAHNFDKARAFTTPVMVGVRPTYQVAEISAPAQRVRILVGGKDVTFFRGVPTPVPPYRLIEPLEYGAGTLELPQISPAFEEWGTGSLRWLRKDKMVKIQRVDVATNTVVATDYIGLISDFNMRGNTLTCDLAGWVAGKAGLMDRQPPLFRQTKDVGNWVFSAVTQAAPVRFTPRLGPVTGIELAARGGTSHLDYINEMLALSVHQSGAQWTVGRLSDGAWSMWLKDTTTVDATIYLDDSRMVADLHQSLAEEPNRIFVSCISPDGRRIKFGAYPGLMQGDPPPYPFTAGTPFGEGTTNAMTDTGDGITVMLAHLVTMSYLTPRQNDGAYDAQVTRAIKRLQDDAGLTESGIMNPATWDALYDLSATGYSLTNSRIRPAAQHSSVKPWNLTASGAISSRNPNFKPHKSKSDRTVNLGVTFTVQQARQYARDLLREANTPNWVGTITLNLSALVGEHNPGDPLTALMPGRAFRPGMNVWLPTFDGGTLVHVSGVEVPGSGPVVLTVDTRARDTMAAWEAITRNRESRINPSRAWLNNHRQSEMTKDNFNEWDEVAGLLDGSVSLKGGQWNIVQTVGAQAGTVQRLRIDTTTNTRYAVAVFARSISERRLNHLIPAPLTEAGTAKWDKTAVRRKLDDRGWVYQAGRHEQRCGYYPGAETGQDGNPTSNPVTGRWDDDAGFGYHTFAEPVLYVAIWPEVDTKIPAGRIMWNQLEAGA